MSPQSPIPRIAFLTENGPFIKLRKELCCYTPDMEFTIAFNKNGLVIDIPVPRNNKILAFQNDIIYPFWKKKGIKNLLTSDFSTLKNKFRIFKIKLTFFSDKVKE